MGIKGLNQKERKKKKAKGKKNTLVKKGKEIECHSFMC